MSRVRISSVLAAPPFTIAIALFFTSGCGGPGGGAPPPTHAVKIDVGGAVVYAGDPAERLEGVTVTLTDLDGDTRTATTGASGLWRIDNLRPGVYVETYELMGYETASRTFGLDAGGPQDVRNVFVPRPDMLLRETRLVADVGAPFSTVVLDGDAPVDGFAGNVLVYRPATDGDIVITFSRRLLDGGEVRFLDTLGGFEAVDAKRSDSATQTTFTVRGSDLAQLNGDNGPAADTDPLTFSELRFEDLDALTPLHGDPESFDAIVRFNVQP